MSKRVKAAEVNINTTRYQEHAFRVTEVLLYKAYWAYYRYFIYHYSEKRYRVRNARMFSYHIRAVLYGMDFYNGRGKKVLAVDHKRYVKRQE